MSLQELSASGIISHGCEIQLRWFFKFRKPDLTPNSLPDHGVLSFLDCESITATVAVLLGRFVLKHCPKLIGLPESWQGLQGLPVHPLWLPVVLQVGLLAGGLA